MEKCWYNCSWTRVLNNFHQFVLCRSPGTVPTNRMFKLFGPGDFYVLVLNTVNKFCVCYVLTRNCQLANLIAFARGGKLSQKIIIKGRSRNWSHVECSSQAFVLSSMENGDSVAECCRLLYWYCTLQKFSWSENEARWDQFTILGVTDRTVLTGTQYSEFEGTFPSTLCTALLGSTVGTTASAGAEGYQCIS